MRDVEDRTAGAPAGWGIFRRIAEITKGSGPAPPPRRAAVLSSIAGCALAVALTPAVWRPLAAATTQPALGARWYKGNTHAHTVNSDGDSTPDEVVRWYREHGYQFLVLTDHNYLTAVSGLNAVHGAAGKFLVIAGEEVTSAFSGKPIHVNGLNLARQVEPPSGATSVVDALQRSVDGIRAEQGVPHINHPNFGWAFSAAELAQLDRTRLFEIYNGHPRVNNLGGGGTPGLEEVWDRILTSGRLMYGLAVDDAHTFKRPGDGTVPGPGRGWVVVRAPSLDARAIVDALDRGEFYSSTGVELSAYDARAEAITIDVRADAWSKYRVQFIGPNGQVLSEQTSLPAVYRIRGDERYVRARVVESNGQLAWTQPVPIGTSAPR